MWQGIGTVRRSVTHTPELSRVMSIARRAWSDADMSTLVDAMTEACRRPDVPSRPDVRLRPIQALALFEIADTGGLLGPIRVGGGKTLTSLLAPWVLDSRRPMLLLPAKLKDKTRREAAALSASWRVPNFLRIESYEQLSQSQSAHMLDAYRPDLIVADEAHKLKNPKAAVTRRVTRYMREHPGVHFVALSGTITKRSLRDYAHLARWSMAPEHCPIPASWSELEDWGAALDEKPHGENVHPGALLAFADAFAPEAMGTDRDRARQGWRARLVSCPGVVATSEGPLASCSLSVATLDVTPPPEVTKALDDLESTWELPDGHPISDAVSMWRHARELALGFYYRWEPRPPEPWMLARKVWARTCRAILSDNRRNLDSELQVTQAVDAGHYPHAREPLAAWRAIRETFRPKTVPVWLSDFVVRAVEAWASKGPGIVWCEHVWMGERLANDLGLRYYGAGGVHDRTGEAIEHADRASVIVASIEANAEGRNLQAWSRNLVVSPPPNGLRWEQLLGRTHRDGQTADEVTCEVLSTAYVHTEALDRALSDARYIGQSTGQIQKLEYCDKVGWG